MKTRNTDLLDLVYYPLHIDNGWHEYIALERYVSCTLHFTALGHVLGLHLHHGTGVWEGHEVC